MIVADSFPGSAIGPDVSLDQLPGGICISGLHGAATTWRLACVRVVILSAIKLIFDIDDVRAGTSQGPGSTRCLSCQRRQVITVPSRMLSSESSLSLLIHLLEAN